MYTLPPINHPPPDWTLLLNTLQGSRKLSRLLWPLMNTRYDMRYLMFSPFRSGMEHAGASSLLLWDHLTPAELLHLVDELVRRGEIRRCEVQGFEAAVLEGTDRHGKWRRGGVL